MVMDRLLLKKCPLTSSLSKLTNNTKRESRPSRCILFFTAFEMKMMSSDKEVRNRIRARTICQHCFGNSRGFKAPSIIQS